MRAAATAVDEFPAKSRWGFARRRFEEDKLFFYLNYELLRYKDQDPARVNNLTSKGEALLAATSSISHQHSLRLWGPFQ